MRWRSSSLLPPAAHPPRKRPLRPRKPRPSRPRRRSRRRKRRPRPSRYALPRSPAPRPWAWRRSFRTPTPGTAANDYEYALYGAADELTPQLLQGGVDIAAVPLNLASVLYNKTSGGVKLCAVGVLGVLYITEFNGETVQSLADLKGKTVYATGKGSTPEYFLRYLARRKRARSRHRRDRGMEERAERGRRAPQGRKRRHCDAAAALCHRRCRAARRGLPHRGEPFRGVGRAR